jgi:hypothetical protein
MLSLYFTNCQQANKPKTHIQQPVTKATVPAAQPVLPGAQFSTAPIPQPIEIPQQETPQVFVPIISTIEQVPVEKETAGITATTLLSDDVGLEGTTLLSEQGSISYDFLIRTSNEDKIFLNKPVFRIGKEKSYVDYFVADNNTVSRSHADFITKNEKCFILDHNSTNKTFIDGMVVETNKEIMLSNGMKIKLANEEFTYYAK